ncbi:myosin-9-like isoform X2 [Varroa destructor]|uniref:Uncharacterized protein n=1 Tax=Varroa destructor TaxID=109461 RepID=A0A7M7KRG5_VARDE|nr:myosin-9-like isoform X2 [Varroa destructor]
MSAKQAAACSGFVPGMVRPTRCKRCFGDVGDHKPKEPIIRRRSLKEGEEANGIGNGPKSRSNSLVQTPEENNVTENNSADVEFILKVKGAMGSRRQSDDARSVSTIDTMCTATTDTTDTTLQFQDSYEDLMDMVNGLRKQLEASEQKVSQLEKEKVELIQRKSAPSVDDKKSLDKAASELLQLRTKLHKAEANTEELKDDNKVLALQVKELEAELDQIKEVKDCSKEELTQLRNKLSQAEALCEEIMEENEHFKKENRDLEQQIEEMHDNFREDHNNEFLEAKRDLDAAQKNCRVLQFKMRKAEKRVEQLELEKSQLDETIKELEKTARTQVDKTKMRNLEEELRVAQELNNRLTKEQAERPKSVGGDEYERLSRDLLDSMEREADLKEQLRYAEEESQSSRKKLAQLEQENEVLIMQVHKMTKGGASTGDAITPEEMKIQMEIQEKEILVYKRRAEDLDHKNEALQKEVRALEIKLINTSTTKLDLSKLPPGSDKSPIGQKVKLLEMEAKELRAKVIEKEREVERLNAELQVQKRKVSKQLMVRSRSLDGDLQVAPQVDLKRKLQVVEEEAAILKRKISDLEEETERLSEENKRLHTRASRRPTPSPADQLLAENGDLKLKVEELEKKLAGANRTLDTVNARSTEGRPPSGSDKEELNGLRKTLRSKDEQIKSLEEKIKQLSNEFARINKENKKLIENMGYQRRPPRIIKDTATIRELREIIKDLEDEIGDLQISLRSTEITQDGKIADLQKERNRLREDLCTMEARLKNGGGSSGSSSANDEKLRVLTQQLDTLNHTVKQAQVKLKEAQSELTSKTKAIESSHLLNKKLDKEVQQLKDELDVARSSRPGGDRDKERRIREEYERKIERAAAEAKKVLSEELENLRKKLQMTQQQCDKREDEVKRETEKIRTMNQQFRKEKDDWNTKITDLEEKLRSECRRRERLERDHENELKAKAEELVSIQNKIFSMERDYRRLQGRFDDEEHFHNQQLKQLEKDLSKKQQELEDAVNKYEVLEEEHISVRMRLQEDKDRAESIAKQSRHDYERVNMELSTLRESIQSRHEAYTNEKLEFQNYIHEVEGKVKRLQESEVEKQRLRQTLKECEAQIDDYKRSERAHKEEKERLKTRNDELQMKLGEMERTERSLRTLQAGNTQESSELRAKLQHSGHAHKAEVAALRSEYEGKLDIIAGELDSMQGQIISLAKERDNLREQLEEAKKELNRLKGNAVRDERIKSREAAEHAFKKMEELRFQAQEIKNQLDYALSENRKMRIQIDADKSSFEIQVATLKSKLNQYEEAKLLETSRGSNKLYAKTRLELAWEKERQDQQKVLHDAQRILRDLKERLLRAEHEREQHRELLNKQMQKQMSELSEDQITKELLDLQAELDEAKENMRRLRHHYERSRKERERLTNERDEYRAKTLCMNEVHSETSHMAQDFARLVEMIQADGDSAKSRPLRPNNREQIRAELQKLVGRMESITKLTSPAAQIARNQSFKRAVSASDVSQALPFIRAPPRTKSKKAMSLGQGFGSDQKLWAGSGDSLASGISPAGSQTSLQRHATGYDSDASIVSAPAHHYGKPGVSFDSDNDLNQVSDSESLPGHKIVRKKTLKERIMGMKSSMSRLDVTPDRECRAGSLSRTSSSEAPKSVLKYATPKRTGSNSSFTETQV